MPNLKKLHLKGPKLKLIYSEKATKFFEISTLLLSYVVPVKSKVEISQNFVAFSECMNFKFEIEFVQLCIIVLQYFRVTVDRRKGRNVDTGGFELIYKQNLVQPPLFVGTSLCVQGHKVSINANQRA